MRAAGGGDAAGCCPRTRAELRFPCQREVRAIWTVIITVEIAFTRRRARSWVDAPARVEPYLIPDYPGLNRVHREAARGNGEPYLKPASYPGAAPLEGAAPDRRLPTTPRRG